MSDAPLVGMGPHLRGTSPPFTPSGKAAFTAQNVSFAAAAATSGPRNQAGHAGLLVRFRCDPAKAASLLPEPLEPNERTGTPFVFLNQTQTGKSREFILGEHPQLANWHEICVQIPCTLGDVEGSFEWIIYKDPSFDPGIVLGSLRGFTNKTAHFSTLFPFAGQPLNRVMGPGRVARFVVSRFDEKILDCTFVAEQELTEEEKAVELSTPDFFNVFGLRYLPDWANPGGPPLVHDIVLAAMEQGHYPVAFRGKAALRFGESEDEELHLLQPLEMLPSHYVHLRYRGGPGVWRVAHDYLERSSEGGRTIRRRTSEMGRDLRGASPPFSPSGKAAYVRSTDLAGGEAGVQVQAGHVGILARWRCDRRSAELLLPPPLEPSEATDRPLLFLNETQTGLNLHAAELERLKPTHVSWHEALVGIPCLCEGKPAIWHPVFYKDVDHGVLLGLYDGFWTKLAQFHKTFPFPPQPLNARMEPGGVARMTISRLDERIITCEFRCERELAAAEIPQEIDLDEWLRDVGVRYWPDYARPGAPPLAHDLVVWNMHAGAVTAAWRGEISLSLGRSDYEELHLLEPLEMLPSYFVHLEYQAGPGRCHVVHDYVEEPL